MLIDSLAKAVLESGAAHEVWRKALMRVKMLH